MQNSIRIENCVQTLAQTVAAQATKITNIEQIVGSLVARVTSLETNATSGSSSPDSTRSWNMLGQSTRSTATGSLGSHGPGSSSDNRQDADLILPQALLMNMREVASYDSRANNTTKGLQSGSMLSVKKPTCLPTEGQLQFTAKQVPRRSSLYLNHEPNVKIVLSDIKIVASPMRLTVPFATPEQLVLSANLRQLKTERLANNLHLCGESCLTSLKFSSLREMTKVHLSSQRSTLAHISSASKIEEMELENQCSNLLLLEAGKLLHLLHLSCLSLVFLLIYYNTFSLKPTSPMYDGRSFASPLFRRLAVRGAFFLRFPVSMGPTLCVLFDSQCCFA